MRLWSGDLLIKMKRTAMETPMEKIMEILKRIGLAPDFRIIRVLGFEPNSVSRFGKNKTNISPYLEKNQ